MATPSGAPPNTTPTATTNSTSGDKKKLFIGLGVAGVAALGLGGYFLMNSMGGGATDATTNVATTNAATPAEDAAPGPQSGTPGSTLANGGIPPASAIPVSTGSNPSTLLPLSPYRRDPFQPFVILAPAPTPVPTPRPRPRPTPTPRPVVIPQIPTIDVPGVNDGPFGSGPGGGSGSPFAVPGVSSAGGAAGPGSRPLILPEVVIPRLNSNRIVPTTVFPPPRSSSGGGSGVTTPSFDKRLSGVVIGNGVRAVLEISGGATPKSYVVQPGDVVEGITILNIQRFTEGGKQVTRMLIRENGGERTVDLKPGPPRTGAGAEGGGFPGAGGFGGRPGGFGGP